jgi:hypothetical protein
MHDQKPRPHGSVTSQRAAGSEELLRGASNSPDINNQGYEQVPIAWAHIFITRFGHVGYWIPVCPFCWFEHAHGGDAPFDPRQKEGWRCSHCFQAPRKYWELATEGTYYLKLVPGPARFAPGAARSRRAQLTMNYLRSIGIETSNETISSSSHELRWRWR